MPDNIEPPYVEVHTSAMWTADLPEWVDSDDIHKEGEIEQMLIENLELDRDSIPEDSVSVDVEMDITLEKE